MCAHCVYLMLEWVESLPAIFVLCVSGGGLCVQSEMGAASNKAAVRLSCVVNCVRVRNCVQVCVH